VYFEDKKTSKLDKLSKDKVCQICDGAQGNVCNQARYHLENVVIESISLVKILTGKWRRLAPAGFDLDLENTSSFLSFLFFAGLQGKTPLVVEYVSRIGPEINITSELRREGSFGKET